MAAQAALAVLGASAPNSGSLFDRKTYAFRVLLGPRAPSFTYNH